jgi:spore maturation protein A
MIIALVVGAITGRIDAVTKAAVDNAAAAVEIALGLIGIMTLWLGIMKIAEAGGIIKILSRLSVHC